MKEGRTIKILAFKCHLQCMGNVYLRNQVLCFMKSISKLVVNLLIPKPALGNAIKIVYYLWLGSHWCIAEMFHLYVIEWKYSTPQSWYTAQPYSCIKFSFSRLELSGIGLRSPELCSGFLHHRGETIIWFLKETGLIWLMGWLIVSVSFLIFFSISHSCTLL